MKLKKMEVFSMQNEVAKKKSVWMCYMHEQIGDFI